MANFLYNGVELPDINEVWTDKATYPYAFISGGADFGYSLTCTKVQPIHYGDGEVEIRNTATIVYLCVFLPGETEWTIFGEDVFEGTGSYIVASGTAPVVWTNTDILNTDNTVYFAASTPTRVDSKLKISIGGGANGDGFALYNGVKLPNIDSVWTDKETYPYGCLVNSDGLCILYLTDYLFTFDGEQVVKPAGNYITIYLYANDVEAAASMGIPVGEWVFVTAGADPNTFVSSFVNWSNYDILNTDGSVYLAASDPIPLDGMNVIEWDGDTTGLTELSNFGFPDMYMVANTHIEIPNSGSYVCAVWNGKQNLVYTDQTPLIQQSAEIGGGGYWALTAMSGAKPFVASANVPDYALVGTAFLYIGEGLYTSLFAYPASGGCSVTATTADVTFTCTNLENTEPVDSIHAWVYKKSDGLNTTISPTWTSEMFNAPSYNTTHTFTGLTPNTEYEVYGCIFVNGEATDHNAIATFTTLEGEGGSSHITTSSGDGFALYNGIKLPNIDTLWDKIKYPYAFIIFNDTSAVAPGTGTYEVRFASSEYGYNGTRFYAIEDGFYTSYQIPANQATIDLLISLGSTVALDKWSLRFEDKEAAAGRASELDMRWSSFDIEGFGDASPAIPLDGMNVIEWDGVTDGNSIEIQTGYSIQRIGDYLPTDTYGGFVTSNTAADSNPITIFGSPSGSYSSIPDSYTAEASIFDNDSWLVSYIGDELDYSVNALLSVNGNLPMTASVTVSEGLWVPVISVNGSIAMYTPLVAYRTASDESNEPIITETSGNGFALYNGVKLLNIPDVHQYNVVGYSDYVGVLMSSTAPVSFVNNVWQFPKGATVNIYQYTSLEAVRLMLGDSTITAEEILSQYNVVVDAWDFQQEINVTANSYGITSINPIWADHDVLNADGSVYQATSDPIPLDGMRVIEWNGGTAGLTNSGTGLYKITDDVFASNQVIGGVFVQNISSKLTAIRVTSDVIEAYEGGIRINAKIYSAPANTLMPEAGTYFVKLVSDYVSLFAYPTSGGGGGSNPPITSTINIIYKGNTKLEAGKTATLKCIGKNCAGDIVAQFGVSGSIIYNGKETVVEAGKTATINCYLKNMLTDVIIKANKS